MNSNPQTPAIAAADAVQLRVLVAEDNYVNRRYCLETLKRLGILADSALNGLEVLERYQSAQYDLILMDCQMPEMDGLEATAEIRRLESLQPAGSHRTTIIAVTANALITDRQRCLSAGMDDYLSKPFSAQQLRALIEKQRNPVPSTNDMPGRLRELCSELDTSVVISLVIDFLGDLPNHILRIKERVAASDGAGAAKAVHSLKGLIRTFGLNELAETILALEKAALTEDQPSMLRLTSELEGLLVQSSASLRKWLESTGQ